MAKGENLYPVHKHVRLPTGLALGIKALALGEEETEHTIIRQALSEYLAKQAPDVASAAVAVDFLGEPLDQLDIEANIYIGKRRREREERRLRRERH